MTMSPHLLLRDLLVGIITFYQRYLSRLKGPCCRFQPNCSEYARQALLTHGIMHGIALTAWRLCRCQPLYRGPVYDPVPPPGKTDSQHREIR
ncbi:MAG TPA: membrane protein insertion efficiency factor YidD [Lentisphaeria bacterium]|nr:membrane protein insertion efficiency factor YidD [Lentisphaerota bacterium]OQC16980.1 MAG: putative membrane protein insertion efficiency factor [Lentisphaerae bacterium ADurb.Bin082]HPY90912.1 membrane protein insertion efficiency factor YidD [Lentisphaeria bacterium]HQC53874.1 membrane protein insertion efficiency factor YidD [Lentisphaeria bacterium]HQL86960.1 membrane protein insertion efficiency factor YidD [Lentisphaeria bacterium]